jgi:hypothetical protein
MDLFGWLTRSSATVDLKSFLITEGRDTIA